jgi:hypothetical protein
VHASRSGACILYNICSLQLPVVPGSENIKEVLYVSPAYTPNLFTSGHQSTSCPAHQQVEAKVAEEAALAALAAVAEYDEIARAKQIE